MRCQYFVIICLGCIEACLYHAIVELFFGFHAADDIVGGKELVCLINMQGHVLAIGNNVKRG
eukprot:733643-Ditylum_brightwellii.AAC.1